MKRAMYVELVAGLFIVLFVYAALTKLVDFNTFEATLKGQPRIGFAAKSIALSVIGMEWLLVGLLCVPRIRITGLIGCIVLLTIFSVYIMYMVLFDPIDIMCACGGLISRMTWPQHILFNTAFIVLGVSAVITQLHANILLQQSGSKLKTRIKE